MALLAALALAVPAGAFPAYLNYQGKLGAQSSGACAFSEDVAGADALNVTNGLYSVQMPGAYPPRPSPARRPGSRSTSRGAPP